jgi:hypothetical protein
MGAFTVPELLACLDQRVLRRRVYDVLAILLGCGFFAKNPSKKKSYMMQGIEGTRALYHALRNSKGVACCPFSDSRPLRCASWNMMKALSEHDNPWMSKKQWIGIVGSRRYYDVLNVMHAMGLLHVLRKGSAKLSDTVVMIPHSGDASADQSFEVSVRPRIIFNVSDEDALAIWPQLCDVLDTSTIKQDVFIF